MSTITKHTGDLWKNQLANVLDERVARIKGYVEGEQAVPRDELAKLVWGTARKIHDIIQPHKEDPTGSKKQAWNDCKGFLKELIDREKFKHAQCSPACINHVLEKKVVEILEAYKNFVLTGEILTKWPPPKHPGESDEIVCVDKPCKYTCGYGDRGGVPASPAGGSTSVAQGVGSTPPDRNPGGGYSLSQRRPSARRPLN